MIEPLLFGLGAYALGCVSAGFYVVRLLTGDDVRRGGSGVTGATNVRRRLGPGWFAVTLAFDAGKGLIVVWAATRLGLGDAATAVAIAAVVAGHIWPVQLGFRGGRGIATSLGAFAGYDVRIVLVVAVLFGLWFLILRRFVVSGLLAYLAAPLLLPRAGVPPARVFTAAIVIAIVLSAHRGHLSAALRGLAWRREPPAVPAAAESRRAAPTDAPGGTGA